MSLFIGWQETGTIVQGASIQNGVISFPVITPGIATAPISLLFYLDPDSTTPVNSLQNIQLYLDGDPESVSILQNIWPSLGGSNRQDQNGGLEISFDGGISFNRFNSTYGLLGNPSTWITLPAKATSFSSIDGQMGPTDVAGIQLRLVIPPGATQYQKLSFQIQVSWDVR